MHQMLRCIKVQRLAWPVVEFANNVKNFIGAYVLEIRVFRLILS